ncbi:hypothetical protein Q7C36_000207 [Tachysurus vachellii]|uniref:Uncharacterized protein n=1 Tax=Tachysurus vachellii TaxID=175792 RepID=A0AA88NYT3_TACVA|nr:hypothetical protein Q7C36_000207 [Tachysurus vachellii]
MTLELRFGEMLHMAPLPRRDEAQVCVWVKTREGRTSLANVRFDGGRKIISEELKDGFYVRCLVSCGTRSPGMFAV